MLLKTTSTLIFTLMLLSLVVIVSTSSLLNFLLLSEFLNFTIFPALLVLAVVTNNPVNLFLIIPTTVFAATETALIGLMLTHTNNK